MRRGLANSQRLAELEARSEAAAASEERRAADRLPVLSLERRLHAHQPRHTVLDRAARARLRSSIPTSRQLSESSRRPVADLHRRPGRRAGARRARRAGSGRRRPRRGAGRSPARDHAAFWALVTATESERVVSAIAREHRRPRPRSALAPRAGAHPAQRSFCPPRRSSRASACLPSKQPTSAAYPRQTCSVCSAPTRRGSHRAGSHPRAASACIDRRRGRARGAGTGPTARAARAGRSRRQPRESASPRRGPSRARRSSSPAGTTTRGPNPRIFPRVVAWEDSWDVVGQRDLVALGRRPQPGGAGRGRRDGPRRRGARARFRSPGRLRGPPAPARGGLEPRRHRRGRRRRSRRARRHSASSASASAPASRPTPKCSTRRPRCCRRELDQTRALANARLADARLVRAVGR